MTTTTTTETRDEPITTIDKRALRHADRIVFRLYQGQATIEAYLEPRNPRNSTGFEQKHTIYVGGTHVSDYGKTYSWVSAEDGHRYSGFHMESSSQFSPMVRTLIDRLRVGGHVALHWRRDNLNGPTRDAGIVVDDLFLHVTPPAAKTAQVPAPPDVYMVRTFVGLDNSARMIQIDWNGV